MGCLGLVLGLGMFVIFADNYALTLSLYFLVPLIIEEVIMVLSICKIRSFVIRLIEVRNEANEQLFAKIQLKKKLNSNFLNKTIEL